MADTRYLRKREEWWYVRIARTPRKWGLGGKEFTFSLATGDLKVAQGVRDQYLIPLLAATKAGRMLETLLDLIAQANANIARRLGELRPGMTGLAPETLPLREAAEEFLSFLKASGDYSGATLAKYRSSADAICALLGEDRAVAGITRRDVGQLRDELLRLPRSWQRMREERHEAKSGETTLRPQTVGRILGVGRRMLRWLRDEGHLPGGNDSFENITVARLRPEHKRAPTAQEAEGLLALPCPTAIDPLTWKMMPLMARYTGCRAGELAQLWAEDVVMSQGIQCLQIRPHGEGQRLKTAGSERLIPVSDRLSLHLDELLTKRSPGRLLDAGDYQAANGTMRRAHGFLLHYNRRCKTVAPDLSFHCWRVYVNDAMATANVDIGDRERILGHMSGRTQSAYTPENLRRLKRAVDSIL